MTLSIQRLQVTPGDGNYQSEGFRNNIEDHLQYLKNNAATRTTAIEGIKGEKYRGDFYGLLADMGIKHEIHWIVLRMNDLHSPLDYNGDMDIILIPDDTVLKRLVKRYTNSSTIL